MQPRIFFEDEYIIVVDKPSGMIVNRADTTKGIPTLQEWVETRLKMKNEKLKIDQESDFYRREGIIHRLDKETSGILLVAKTPEAFENLQKQFKERRVKKVYIALCHGKVVPTEGEIRVPVGRLPWHRERFGVVAGGKEAITKYKILRYYDIKILGKTENLSLVELYPETGRTHQIRVHLKHIHHPIFSDFLYAGRKTARNDRKVLSRVFLHAAKLTFYHPQTGEEMTIESLLPEELADFLESLVV